MIRRSKFEKQVLPHSYKLVTNRSELIVSYTDTRPVQFDLCTLPCADTFIDKRGSGWNENNIAEYFSVTSTDRGGTQSIKNQYMTTSLQYEAHHITLWTIREIRVTNVKNKKQFHIRCQTKAYQVGNKSLRARHRTMFREDTFTFPPIDELVMSMPFEFISKLKVGTWTRVDQSWLRRLHTFLTQADNHAIKQIRFVRRIY